ncbi:hypothetical protein M9Y10_002425 [Tritrichomonas musculus]|uniref:Uncharacterized protein n=1 Tax=Tritrichomonas musculus TaxID=1915356 RepID=A0ABR2LA48_9EUKA
MKGNFSRFVQEGRLIEFHFEPEPMHEVLNEILQLLSSVDTRLNELESKVPSFAMQKQVDDLHNENKNILHQLDQTIESADTKLDEHGQKINEQLEESKKYVDDSISAVLVDVRRFMKTQLDDVINANENANANNDGEAVRAIRLDQRSNNSIDEAFKVCSDIQSQIDLIQKDVNEVRRSAEAKVTPEMLKKELEPFIKNTERIGDCDADILTLQLSLQNLKERVENIETVQKIPGTKVEVVVQKPIEVPVPEPQNPLLDHEHQMQHKQQETKMKVMQQQLQKIQSNIVVPPTDDSASIERQVRRLNEFASSFRLALDNHDQSLKSFEEKIEHHISQANMKRLQDLQNVDQLTSELDRVKEQITELTSTDFSKSFEELNSKINNFQKDINNVNEKVDRRNRVVRTEAKYADRLLPPLQTQDENDIDNEDFGFEDSSNELLINVQNSRANSSFNTSRRKGNDLPDEFPSPPMTSRSSDRKILSSRRKENVIKIIRQTTRVCNSTSNIAPIFNMPALSEEEIQEKVNLAIRKAVAGFLDRAKAETQKEIQNGLKVVDQISTKIDQKIDRDFVERMFNKFRIIIADLKEKIDQIQSTFLGWVTREELQQVLEKFVDQLHEVKDTCGGSSKYKCLLCGRPRTHVSGMIVGDALANNYGDEDDEVLSNYGEDKALKIKRKASTRLPSPTTPKNPKRCKTPVPRDVIQLLTSTEARK